MDPATIAYLRGMADYEACLTANTIYYNQQSSPEELAYYQGMADYEAALMGGEEDASEEHLSPEEAAYYQGMADCEAMLMESYF